MIPDPVVMNAKKILEDVALGVVAGSSSPESDQQQLSKSAGSGISSDMEFRWKKDRESPPLIPLESVLKVSYIFKKEVI